MTARIWHGRTKANLFDAYSSFLKEKAIPDYQMVPGLQKLIFLRQIKGLEAHFTLITFWDGIDSIKNFAGEDFEKAKYYPEDKTFLLDFEERVEHYEVFADMSANFEI